MTRQKTISKNLELATFYVGEALCGIDILNIQEINKQFDFTTVPQSENFVKGVLNLRGRIVTILDLGKKLGLSPVKKNKSNRNIIVNFYDEQIGLLVDKISDVIVAKAEELDTPPANLGGIQGSYFENVVKTEKTLIGILDIDKVLSTD
ncbi:MAG: chemotaxis protein CheW [Desulforegulaceae bacterium]|jgi:purine-binding chemotaxis protein CheW|nr:chemotaxis protein CheW [Desulforegulaceae bacterium]